MRFRGTVAFLLLLAACSRGSDKKSGVGENLLAPQFAPDTTVVTTTVAPGQPTAPGGGATTSTPAAGSAAAPTRPPAQVPAPVVPGATTAAIVDRQGDLTPSPADPPPPWADLVGGTLIRRADGFELRVRLGGGSAPSTTDKDHTMNIASFYDVDGDGRIDYEVWANLASGGWGGSWRDDRKRTARFGDRAEVAVTVAGDEVVLRFPLAHIGGADRFRWSLASEWGRYEVLGSLTTARDDAPDFDAAARFPG